MSLTDRPTKLDVTPLSATIGAEIRGVDLRNLDTDTVAAIRRVWLERKVVFFPAQHLNADEHVAFALKLGEPTEGHPVIPGMKENPEIFEIDYTFARQLATQPGREPPPQRGIDWHTDVTYMPEPPMASILRAITIPPSGGDTMFSDQQAAYEGLSPTMQSFLGTLTAMHDGRSSFQRLLDRVGEGKWNGEAVTSLDPSEHPVIRTHPETGAKTLFVNAGFTTHIVGLERDESDALLRFLYKHSVKPEYTMRYHWHEGDVGMWDNRQTQHAVVGDFGDQHRVIQRVTLRGDAPT
jgi:taurine dioxygenase